MLIETDEFKKEDGTRCVVRVIFTDRGEWILKDIKYKEKRQREWRYLEYSYRDLYKYRQLDTEKRKEYANKIFTDFVGEERILWAYQNAWEKIKPKQIEESDDI